MKQPKRILPSQLSRKPEPLAAFDAVIKMRDDQWAAMTPQERAEEDRAWEQVKNSINGERAGYRQVFVDE